MQPRSTAVMTIAVLALCTVLVFSARGVAAQSTDEDASPDAAQVAGEGPPDGSQPTATPLVVYIMVTATPVPTIEATPTPVIYATRKGPRSEDDLRAELTSAGYIGPWDTSAMLAAYDRATAPTSTPVPTWTSVPVPTQRTLDPALVSRCYQFSVSLALSMNQYVAAGSDAAGRAAVGMDELCRQSALNDGVAGEQCLEFAMRQFFQVNLNTAGGAQISLVDTLYRGCLGQ
jgi:hypothetical protein